jgi:hypothetical protein
MSDCANFIHEWIDHYYGIECKNCKLMIPGGIGPWMPNAKDLETPAHAQRDQVIDAKGKRAKEIDAARALGP